MKKTMDLLLCVGLLVGCQSKDPSYSFQVSDHDQVLVKDDKISITKQDYFNELLNQYGPTTVLDKALQLITDIEIKDKKAIDQKIKQKINDYKEYTDGHFDEFIKSSGYENEKDFIKNVVELDAKIDLLYENYIKDNFDKLVKDYEVVSYKTAKFDKESEALEAKKKIKNLKDFESYMNKNDGEDAGVVTKESTLDEEIVKILPTLAKMDKDGVYTEAVKLVDGKYALIYVYDAKNENKNDIISALSTVTPLVDKITGHYLKEYDFEVYDETIKDAIHSLSKEYIE